MVFLIQQSQNKDSVAVHLKLDELLSSQERASNQLVDVENLDETQLKRIAAFYAEVARRAQDNPNDAACSFGDSANEKKEREAAQKIPAGLVDTMPAKDAIRSPVGQGQQKKDEK
jgi:low affinity Fe/Cu permease